MGAGILEYQAAGVPARDVWPQSFDLRDVLCWVEREPAFGRQAVYLDDAATVADLPGPDEPVRLRSQGVRIVAPPTFALLALDAAGRIVPSQHARHIRAAGLDIITWALDRSGILADGSNGFYFQTIDQGLAREGDLMQVIDLLAREVGVLGIFSDWPATTTFYANCANLR